MSSWHHYDIDCTKLAKMYIKLTHQYPVSRTFKCNNCKLIGYDSSLLDEH